MTLKTHIFVNNYAELNTEEYNQYYIYVKDIKTTDTNIFKNIILSNKLKYENSNILEFKSQYDINFNYELCCSTAWNSINIHIAQLPDGYFLLFVFIIYDEVRYFIIDDHFGIVNILNILNNE